VYVGGVLEVCWRCVGGVLEVCWRCVRGSGGVGCVGHDYRGCYVIRNSRSRFPDPRIRDLTFSPFFSAYKYCNTIANEKIFGWF